MDKKNTMLLTVIAVATLLVAVVGATFAYFSLTVSGEATTTNATVTTSNPGLIALKEGEKTLELKLNAAEMAQADEAYAKYYALSSEDKTSAEESGNIYSKSVAKEYEIAQFNLTGGDAKAKYSCGYKITITATQGLTTLLQAQDKKLQEGDMAVVITADGIGGDSVNTKTVDLSTLEENKAEVTGTVVLQGTSASKSIKADLYLENRDAEQDYLAGQTLGVTISVDKDEANPCKIEVAGE